ncbi:MAG: acetate--CoA ligase family protein [Desulfobacterales bacterium]|nr:MAG: acetate--CoA ligase family protein [Desulfobacterales bacterium]
MSRPKVRAILSAARRHKQNSLSEYESKRLLSAYGIPVVQEAIVHDWDGARQAASDIGYPVVMKLCAAGITHKTERNLVAVSLRDEADLKQAFRDLDRKTERSAGDLLVQKMVKGVREVAIGMTRDPQFGPCVMFGLGGIFTEVLHDVSFRVAPVDMQDALEMMREIRGHAILDAIRGLEAADRKTLGESLIALGNIGLENEVVQEIDVNPLIICESQPVAVDALVVLKNSEID